MAVLQEFGVTECYYGHLHGKSIRFAVQGDVEGIRYRLISAERLAVLPLQNWMGSAEKGPKEKTAGRFSGAHQPENGQKK